MSDYSSSSFSELNAGYHQNDKKVYREQLGSGDKGLTVTANSFLKPKENRAIWGNAFYQNLKKQPFKWNESLDYERIAPYVSADSVGGSLNVERYFFQGGLSQKIKRWTIAGEISYLAQLGYRSRDPRLKSTTSDLNVKAGVNYRLYKEYELGVFANFNKYTQNSTLIFKSELGKPYVYQMVGLGISNYFFSGGTNPKNTFEEFGYKGGFQISNKQGRDFYVRAVAGKSINSKNHSDNGLVSNYETSELENKNFEIEGAKFFTIQNNHRIGALANYRAIVRTGYEFGYSVNNNSADAIFKRKSYRLENFISTFKVLYQYNQENFTLAASPFFAMEEIKERNLYPVSGQKFEYLHFGISANYRQRINNSQAISIEPYYSQRKVQNSINALATLENNTLNNWVQNDFIYQASQISTFGANVRYDIKLEKLPAFFIDLQYQTQAIQKKNNNFVGASVGITF